MVSDLLFAGEISFELLKELGKLCRNACFLKGEADKLKSSLEELLPIFHEIKYSNVGIPQHRQYQIDELTHKLKQGLDLVRSSSASSRWNVYKNIQLQKKLQNLEKSVSRFLKGPMQAHLMADVHHLRAECGERFDRLEGFAKRLEEGLGNVSVGRGWYLEEVMKRVEKEEERGGDFGGVALGNGLKVGKEKVKEMLIRNEEARVVGISGIGGSGKTTLAKEICRDHQIRRFFNNRVFFETVSQCPNLERLKLRIWEHIYGSRATNPCDPIPQWKLRLEQKTKRPTLVVLDDVWSLSQLEQLIIKVPGCKILVVSRFRFPEVIDHSYEVELLGEEESVSLFCYSAFQQHSIPLTANKKLVNQIVSECKGLPLALKVIGASLKGQPPLVWESAKNRLSKGETISESHDFKLLERMAISIAFLSAKVRECFLDLGSFPEDKKISLDVLLNMWVETHDLDEVDAFAILLELCDKNLLSMVKDPQNRAGEVYCSFNEFWVSQHDVLRDLALQMNNSDGLNRRKRLIMPRRDDRLPKDWQRNKDEPFDAQIVSIHTGEMKEVDWFHMYFPNAEVLVLNLTSNTYFLPPFMKTMPKLKSLILLNSGNSTTILRNLSVFSSLHNLTSLWLEKVTVPPLNETVLPLPNLRKISLVLCELNKSLNDSLVHLPRIFPRLSELIIDYSIDLKKLPSSICEIRSLESLSITNCHDLLELPSQLDHLSSLQVLRIYACPLLKKLPPTICGLKRLKYLDISQCVNLRDLPEGMGQLLSLEKIDMRECSQIMHLPQSTPLLRSLGHVICDEEIAICWKEVEKTIPELRIQVAEECFTLDWLVG